MIARLILWSIANRFLVLLASLGLAAWGVWATLHAPLDAIPDLSDTQVIIRTTYPGQAPQIVENQVTYPLTTTMMSVPGAKEYQADAKLEKFGADTWTITHGPVPELKWGAMTMEFIPMKEGVPPGAKPGQEVRLFFTLDKDGMPVVTKIVPRGAAK